MNSTAHVEEEINSEVAKRSRLSASLPWRCSSAGVLTPREPIVPASIEAVDTTAMRFMPRISRDGEPSVALLSKR